MKEVNFSNKSQVISLLKEYLEGNIQNWISKVPHKELIKDMYVLNGCTCPDINNCYCLPQNNWQYLKKGSKTYFSIKGVSKQLLHTIDAIEASGRLISLLDLGSARIVVSYDSFYAYAHDYVTYERNYEVEKKLHGIPTPALIKAKDVSYSINTPNNPFYLSPPSFIFKYKENDIVRFIKTDMPKAAQEELFTFFKDLPLTDKVITRTFIPDSETLKYLNSRGYIQIEQEFTVKYSKVEIIIELIKLIPPERRSEFSFNFPLKANSLRIDNFYAYVSEYGGEAFENFLSSIEPCTTNIAVRKDNLTNSQQTSSTLRLVTSSTANEDRAKINTNSTHITQLYDSLKNVESVKPDKEKGTMTASEMGTKRNQKCPQVPQWLKDDFLKFYEEKTKEPISYTKKDHKPRYMADGKIKDAFIKQCKETQKPLIGDRALNNLIRNYKKTKPRLT